MGSEVALEEILKKTGSESTNPSRIPDMRGTMRDRVSERKCQAKVSSTVREKNPDMRAED